MKILVAGDFCDKLRVSESIREGRYSSMFDDVKPFTSSVDYSIVNFEFPIVSKEGKPIRKCGPRLKGQAKAIDAIKYAGFNVCTLANNHILDQGEYCCLDTISQLENSGVKTVGAGKNLLEASKILYLRSGKETLAIINCCEHEFSIATNDSAGAYPLNPIQQYYQIKDAKNNADYVLVIVHGGHEMFQLPSPRMVETYRFLVDAGADAVVNHHQHCFSGYETYKGKLIFYGLGNLLFDHMSYRNEIWNEGYMVIIEFNESQVFNYSLIPYQQCQEFVGVKIILKNNNFYKKIDRINEILNKPEQLEKIYKEWVISSFRYSKSLFTPYNNKYLLGLFKKGFLPSFISEQKRYRIINSLFCESHLDKLKISISNI